MAGTAREGNAALPETIGSAREGAGPAGGRRAAPLVVAGHVALADDASKKEERQVRLKRMVVAIAVAAGMFLAPLPTALHSGAGTVFAMEKECKLEIEICQEINLVFWKYHTCYRYKTRCG